MTLFMTLFYRNRNKPNGLWLNVYKFHVEGLSLSLNIRAFTFVKSWTAIKSSIIFSDFLLYQLLVIVYTSFRKIITYVGRIAYVIRFHHICTL